jgi:hypothetical protein
MLVVPALWLKVSYALTPPLVPELTVWVGTTGCPAAPSVTVPAVAGSAAGSFTLGYCASGATTGTLTFSSSDPLASLPAPSNYNSAILNVLPPKLGAVTFRTPGLQTVTVRDASINFLATFAFQVSPEPVFMGIGCAELAIAREPFVAMVGTPHPIFVSNCNATAETVRFTSSDSAATLPASASFPPNTFTQPVGAVTFTRTGAQVVSIVNASNVLLYQANFNVLPSATSSMGTPVPVNAPLALMALILACGWFVRGRLQR